MAKKTPLQIFVEKDRNTRKANRIKAREKYNKEEYKNGGFVEKPTTLKQNPDEEEDNYITYKMLAENGGKYRILQVVSEPYVKNPDAFNYETRVNSDAKHPDGVGGYMAIRNSVLAAYNQGAQEVVIRFKAKYKDKDIRRGLRSLFKSSDYMEVITVIFIYPDGNIKIIDIKSLRESYKSEEGKPTK
jgi:hypothetical protein